VGPSHSRSVRIVDDPPVGHEETDDIGQLVRVAEVDRVLGALDDDEQRVVHRLPGDLPQALAAGHERVALPMTARVGVRSASSRSRDGYWVRARNSRKVLGTPNLR
jgi:hypothetical protein